MYTVDLYDLPFKPDPKQVIYVEDEYNDTYNRYIQEHYDELVRTFKSVNLQFIYLPKYAAELCRNQSVLYYAPFINDDIINISNDFLLYHFVRPEDKRNFEPSFVVYNPNLSLEANGYVAYQFCGFKLRIIFQEIVSTSPYDVASFFKDEVVTKLAKKKKSHLNKEEEAWDKLKKCILKFGKSIVVEEDDEPVEAKRCKRLQKADKPKRAITELDQMDEEMKAKSARAKKEVDGLMQMGISQMLLENILFGKPKLSHLLITKDNRLILSDYKNMEIVLPPFNKAIYFFFLRHEEGVRFKELIDFKDEIVELYKRTKAPYFSLKAHESVNKLVELPEGRDNNRINEEVSKINSTIKLLIDERIAEHYCIDGKIGEEKKITLPRDLVKWE